MDNENKWEYDYSSGNSSSGNDTGYPNVGSSGINTANTAGNYGENSESYNQQSTAQPQATQNYTDASGGATPPPPPTNAGKGNPGKKKKPRRRINAGRVLRSVVSLVLVAAVGFAGGFVGSKFGGSKVVIHQAERTTTDSSDTTTTTTTDTQSSSAGLTSAQVAALVSPSVVVITTEEVVYSSSSWSWYGGQGQVQSGAGSGVIISSDGYILTCAHVVEDASQITVTINDTDYTATVVGSDTTSDVAVIKIDADGLTPASVGDSDGLAVGEQILAVGNPMGKFGGTVTSGIISALNRNVSVQSSNSTLNNMSLIQLDAAISPGNSGGGLFDMNGNLVGIVNAKYSDDDADGLGFAIPINDAIKVAEDLLENGYVSGRPYMGITYLAVTDAQTASQLGVSAYGIYIVSVEDGGPADEAGLKAGDRIVSIDGSEVAQKTDLGTIIQNHAAGDTISITVARDGQMVEIQMTLGEKKGGSSSTAAASSSSTQD